MHHRSSARYLCASWPILAVLCTVVRAELNLGEMTCSNLNGQGPAVGKAHDIRYHRAINSNGHWLDLVIVAKSNYEPANANLNSNFGKNHEIGRINMRANSEVNLTFGFVRTDTDVAEHVTEFALTLFIPGDQLKVRMSEFHHYCLSPNTSLESVIAEHPHSIRFGQKKGEHPGLVIPNDPHRLSEREMGMAVTLFFRGTSGFPVSVYTGEGADFMFAGAASVPATKCFPWSRPPAVPESKESKATSVDAKEYDCNLDDLEERFVEILHTSTARTCSDLGAAPINDRSLCEAAARHLTLSDVTVDISPDAGRPEGCYVLRNGDGMSLWLSSNPANQGKGAGTSDIGQRMFRDPLCEVKGGKAWSEDRAAWCCKHKNLGCSARQATEVECIGADWMIWTLEKRRSCCDSHHVGCLTSCDNHCTLDGATSTCREAVLQLMGKHDACSDARDKIIVGCSGCGACPAEDVCATTTTTHTSTTTEPFDCMAGLSTWYRGWAPRKQSWCCEHHSKGCTTTTSSTTTSTRTSTTATKTRTTTITATTTRTSTSTTTSTTRTVTRTNTNTTTSTDTKTRTATSTSTTTTRRTTTTLTHTATTTTTSATTTFGCLAGARWSPEESRWCCEQRSSACPGGEATTSSTTPSAVGAFDCHAEPQLQWSPEKTTWCCKHHSLGCQNTRPRVFDCNIGLLNSENAWSAEKKGWCCREKNLGCPSTTRPQYDCKAGLANWPTEWSRSKKAWCCDHWDVGCTASSEPYDCSAHSNWAVSWSSAKKTWCCRKHGRGCSGSTSEPFDCGVAVRNLAMEWSTWKKIWCCEHHGRGCATSATSKPFDCQSGIANWQAAWSQWKKDWCCSQEGIGCAEGVASAVAQFQQLRVRAPGERGWQLSALLALACVGVAGAYRCKVWKGCKCAAVRGVHVLYEPLEGERERLLL